MYRPHVDREQAGSQLERSWFHQGSLVLKFAGIDTRTGRRRRCKGWYVCISGRAAAAARRKARFTCRTLIGCEVVTLDGRQTLA